MSTPLIEDNDLKTKKMKISRILFSAAFLVAVTATIATKATSVLFLGSAKINPTTCLVGPINENPCSPVGTQRCTVTIGVTAYDAFYEDKCTIPLYVFKP
nr:hypothetical protein [Pedobacter sp. ASV19]